MPTITISTIYDHVPNLKRYDPNNPPDIKALTMQKTFERVNEDPDLNAYVYSNGYYAISWYDSALKKGCLWFHNMPGLLTMDLEYIWPTNCFNNGRSKFTMTIKPVKSRLHETDLLEKQDDMPRLILIKTLLDVEAILNERYDMHILTTGTKAAFQKELEKI